ncbi:MAG: alpha/beta-hydrolase family protein [Chloroflexi bacterium]|nr:alpha/beta-hydrolase family protein [Chloroflexota bacterium]
MLALVFWSQALTPTFIPRTWMVQTAISVCCLAIGYGIGTLVGRWLHRVLHRWALSPGPAARRRLWLVVAVGWFACVIIGAPVWVRWENEQRDLMGSKSVDPLDAVRMVAVSVAFGAILVVLGRVLANGVRLINRFNKRHVPAVLATPATVLLMVVVCWLGFRVGIALADSHYSSVNDITEEGVVVPASASVSGSSASLVTWDSLGRHGRTFVSSATSTQQLEMFHGGDAALKEPVRVYVGLHSAATAAERADLAVRDLERAGGFERKVLVVWIPTGSGWMVREAAIAIEQLYGGDTAIVAMQYSYLASLFTGILEPEQATEAGNALFSAVHARWSQLPPSQRPKLVLFGKSLGTAGVEVPFVDATATDSVANLVARTDGALIVGGPYDSPMLAQLTREREPGSPVWLPIFNRGRTVRFVNRDPRQPVLDPQWPAPRVVYLQHPSDPASFWGLAALWSPPEWMDHPRGFDVPAGARWFLIVSGVQAVADLVEQLSTPPGFGHVYWTDYVNGWAQAVPPRGWTDADTARLEHFLHDGDAS